jgi:hypothetical protein
LDERVFSPSMCSTIHGVGLALICSREQVGEVLWGKTRE